MITDAHLEVIAGPMFSGKTEELLRRVRRSRIAGINVSLVTHALDTRRGEGSVSSHAGAALPARSVATAAELPAIVAAESSALLAIDEAQFFGPELIDVVSEIVASGTTVIAEGLSVTFDGRPFEPVPSLMAVAEDVVKLTAVCGICGREASFHQRLLPEDSTTPDAESVVGSHVGGTETYAARCRIHFSGG